MNLVRQAILSDAVVNRVAVANEMESLVREHARFVYKLAYSVLRNHHDAEDTAQETFVRVLRHRRKLRDVRNPKLWMAKIAWRVATDRRRRKPEHSLDAALDAGIQFPSSHSGVELAAIREQHLAFLEKAITALPREFRDVVTLTTVAELSGAEIATLLGIPEASVRTRMFRARQILREKLKTFMEGSHEERGAEQNLRRPD